MQTSLDEFSEWLNAAEGQHLEFKEAKTSFQFQELVKYCVALANEGGGKVVLGVTDKPPRQVVGSHAFESIERTVTGLFQQLRLRVGGEVLLHPDGRVVIFHVPSRLPGLPIAHEGSYWMRAGEALVPMSSERLMQLFAEAVPDFSAEVCTKAELGDLDPAAIAKFQEMWQRKSGSSRVANLGPEQLLLDAELIVDDGITYAALILFGTQRALGQHLAQAELVFEYRSSDSSGPAAQRENTRRGFFSYQDELWSLVNLRNDLQHYQQGFFVFDIPTFNETVVREAILNAVSHRDYRLGGSIFVRQFPRRIEIVSPGGFLPGISVDNVLDRQAPRNRRIAETFARCGLVERAGQGMNLIYEHCIQESKSQPDFSGTDDYQVSLTLHGEVQDPVFVRFLGGIGTERVSSFTTHDFLLLDLVRREQPIPTELKSRLPQLLEQGIVERIGRGRGTTYILSRRLYGLLGQRGTYTVRRGLDRETNKSLLLKHIRDNHRVGSPLAELRQVLPALSRDQVQNLMRQLQADGLIYHTGSGRAALWFPVSRPDR